MYIHNSSKKGILTINSLLFVILFLSFNLKLKAQTPFLVSMKEDKLRILLPAKDMKTFSRNKSEIKVLICNPLITEDIKKEIEKYQAQNQQIPREKLEKSFPYTYYKSSSNLDINYYVAVLFFSNELNEENCLWNMTVAFAKMFDIGFNGEKDCSNELEKDAYTDINNHKRNVRVCACVNAERYLLYKTYYFDDRIYFLAAYANGELRKDTPQMNEIMGFFESFSDK